MSLVMRMCPKQRRLLEQRERVMPHVGDRIEVRGTLLRDCTGFLLKCDHGRSLRLNLHRVPVDHVSKHVRIVGVLAGEDQVDVEVVAKGEESSSSLPRVP